MKKITFKIIMVAFGCVAFLGLSLGPGICGQTDVIKEAEKEESTEELYTQVELLSDALSTVKSDFVDEIKSKKLVYGALRGMLAHLDDYSQFMDPDEYNEIKAETKGEFGGVGIEITMRDRILTVIAPIAGSPADKEGIMAGDRIVKINGEITRDITLSQAVKKLRGKPGTDVKLTLWREEADKLVDVTIVRAIIKIDSIKKVSIIEDNIGYIRIVEFQENTPKDLDEALKKLMKEEMDSLVLDLRNNPGGLLDASIVVAEKFLPIDTLIVSTKARIESQNSEFKSKDKDPYLDFPMVVLVSKGSASASEIVAGAIQDNKRGLIVGMPTFGKGSVQTIIPLKDGSALRLTTASYYTPKGRSIRDRGIIPDVVVERQSLAEQPEQKTDIFKKIEKKPGDEKKEKQLEEKKQEALDNQLQQALDLLKGIRIYNTFGKKELKK
ncbi:S41 family peptidase [Candidatus Omnitrophota bacterium]